MDREPDSPSHYRSVAARWIPIPYMVMGFVLSFSFTYDAVDRQADLYRPPFDNLPWWQAGMHACPGPLLCVDRLLFLIGPTCGLTSNV